MERRFPIHTVAGREEANAFLFGVVLNQGQRAEKAWRGALELRQRLGTLEAGELARLPTEGWIRALREPVALHRFPKTMARYLRAACEVLARDYEGDARRLWSPAVAAGVLIRRLEDFPGIGRHKAEVAIFLLTVELGVCVLDDGTKVAPAESCPGLHQAYPLDRPILK
jgi:uncharacterized HhH-GPD family protein